jgi:hypothetical protein
MRQTTFIVYDDNTKYVAGRMCENLSIDDKFLSPNKELTESVLIEMANSCMGEYFYVIVSDRELAFPNFTFSYKPDYWDSEYMHIWANDTSVRLFNTSEVRKDPSKFTDTALLSGSVKLKSLAGKIYNYQLFDIIFLSYDEEYADDNYFKLTKRFPRAKHVQGVKGIFEAHKAAAKLAKTDMFYVVDADAEIVPSFNFNYGPHSLDRLAVHVWHSRNPINDLEYGYGGVKLFPTNLLLNYEGSPIDFTTSVSKDFKVMPEVSNVTRFNTDPFSAWRSGFRECAKLASKIIPNQDNTETEQRLAIWCSVGEDREFGDFAIMGATEGAEFGKAHKDQPELLGLINDFSWLEKRFNS